MMIYVFFVVDVFVFCGGLVLDLWLYLFLWSWNMIKVDFGFVVFCLVFFEVYFEGYGFDVNVWIWFLVLE